MDLSIGKEIDRYPEVEIGGWREREARNECNKGCVGIEPTDKADSCQP